MRDLLLRCRFVIVLLFMIATLWTATWAKDQYDQAERGFWAPEHPELFQQWQIADEG